MCHLKTTKYPMYDERPYICFKRAELYQIKKGRLMENMLHLQVTE